MARPNWQEYFLNLCSVIGTRSTDADTKVGCVIVNKNNKILSTGYNGLPAGICEENWPLKREQMLYIYEGKEGPIILNELLVDEHKMIGSINKYNVMLHAEINAIACAERSIRGCTLYTSVFPCSNCASLIINVGIEKVVAFNSYKRHRVFNIISKELFRLSKISFIIINDEVE